MTDIVERLKERANWYLSGPFITVEGSKIYTEAADEIERLREALELASKPLPSVNWKDGKPYSYCPECGRIDKDNK